MLYPTKIRNARVTAETRQCRLAAAGHVIILNAIQAAESMNPEQPLLLQQRRLALERRRCGVPSGPDHSDRAAAWCTQYVLTEPSSASATPP